MVKRSRGWVPHTLSPHHTKFGGSKFHGKGNEIFPMPIPVAIPISNAEVYKLLIKTMELKHNVRFKISEVLLKKVKNKQNHETDRKMQK